MNLVHIHPESIESIARRVVELMRNDAPQSSGTLDTKGAMHRLGYISAKGFWQAVRRLGVPYSKLSARNCVFRTSDIDAVLSRRQVGSSRR